VCVRGTPGRAKAAWLPAPGGGPSLAATLTVIARLAPLCALAACFEAPIVREPPARPMFEPDPPQIAPPALGLPALRDQARAHGFALELGEDGDALLTFDCTPGEPARAPALDLARRSPSRPALDLVLDPRTTRQCYRCVLPQVGVGPQDPYAPPPTDAALAAIAAGLARLPASFVGAARLERLAVCERLRDDHDATPDLAGLADNGRRRMLIALDSSRPLDQIVAHELFHLFDSAQIDARPPGWAELNPPGFRYGAFGPAAGFAETYGQTNADEDRATVFAELVGDGPAFCDRAAEDPILRRKGAWLRDHIARVVPPGDAAFIARAAPCLAAR
jgi:hypothetical protein